MEEAWGHAAAYHQTRQLLARGRLLEALYVSTANSLTVIQTLEELDPERRVALATTDLFAELVPFLRSGRIRLFV